MFIFIDLKQRFNTDENGTPDFNNDLGADIKDVEPLYQAPMRVNEACRTVTTYSSLIGAIVQTNRLFLEVLMF